jgi:hypothetical protein
VFINRIFSPYIKTRTNYVARLKADKQQVGLLLICEMRKAAGNWCRLKSFHDIYTYILLLCLIIDAFMAVPKSG